MVGQTLVGNSPINSHVRQILMVSVYVRMRREPRIVEPGFWGAMEQATGVSPKEPLAHMDISAKSTSMR
jgi:hypothetical protein